jgi:hypothetical protein
MFRNVSLVSGLSLAGESPQKQGRDRVSKVAVTLWPVAANNLK